MFESERQNWEKDSKNNMYNNPEARMTCVKKIVKRDFIVRKKNVCKTVLRLER